jgi:hypothetical protein
MAKQFEHIEPAHAAFIAQQHIFFTASAAPTGRINISPRGADAFRVLDPNTVAHLDETGSGNETAAHLRLSPRLTIMFCGFENVPMIMRLYGQGRRLPRGTPEYGVLLESAFGNHQPPGARQIIWLDVEMVQTSCGYGVPLFDYKEERPTCAGGRRTRATTALPPTGAKRMFAASTGSRPALRRMIPRAAASLGPARMKITRPRRRLFPLSLRGATATQQSDPARGPRIAAPMRFWQRHRDNRPA